LAGRRSPRTFWIVAAFPVLTATLAMLLLDRYLGFHSFTTDGQGNAMMYVTLLGPGVTGGIYPCVAGVRHFFGGCLDLSRPSRCWLSLHGCRDDVDLRAVVLCLAAPLLHHGTGANVNGFFGVMTMIIAVPTGVKVFNWLFTMYGGRIRFTVPSCGRRASWVTFWIAT